MSPCILHLPTYTMFAAKTILISFPLCIFLRVLLLLISWVWVALCRYFRFHLVICFVDICSNNVVSDGLHFTEYNYCFFGGYFFKVDVLFNRLMIFLFEVFWINVSVMDARLPPLLSFRFGVYKPENNQLAAHTSTKTNLTKILKFWY